MFRTSHVHLQEDCIVHAAVYDMFYMLLCSPSNFLAYDEVCVVSVADTSTEFISHLHSVQMLATETLLELHCSSMVEGLTQFVVSVSLNREYIQ
jgi:hypothetical protein